MATDAAAGEAVAEFACAACHRVRSAQATPAPALDDDNVASILAPSFSSIARDFGVDAARLRTLMARAHYPMPEPPIANAELGPLTDYIISLRYPSGLR